MNIFKKVYNNLYPSSKITQNNTDLTINSHGGGGGVRNALFDNAKFILILSVVFAHFITAVRITDSNNSTSLFIDVSATAKTIYNFIFLFHMPAFIMLAGYFSKENYKKERVIGLTVLYILTQIIFTVVQKYILNRNVKVSVCYPMLWYLMALIFMTICLPILTKNFNPKISIAMVFITGIFYGYVKQIGGFLTLSKFFTFMPFFVIGYYFSTENPRNKLYRFFTLKYRILAIIYLISILIFSYIYRNEIPRIMLLYGSTGYSSLEIPLYGAIYKMLYYIASTLTIFSFMILVPTNKLFFTKFGANTLTVYIIHMMLYFIFYRYSYKIYINQETSTLLLLLISLICSVLITFLLSLPIFSKPFNYLLKGDFKSLYKKC